MIGALRAKAIVQVNLARHVVCTDKNTCNYWYFSLKINHAKFLKKMPLY